jgi:hypothetical protein
MRHVSRPPDLTLTMSGLPSPLTSSFSPLAASHFSCSIAIGIVEPSGAFAPPTSADLLHAATAASAATIASVRGPATSLAIGRRSAARPSVTDLRGAAGGRGASAKVVGGVIGGNGKRGEEARARSGVSPALELASEGESRPRATGRARRPAPRDAGLGPAGEPGENAARFRLGFGRPGC